MSSVLKAAAMYKFIHAADIHLDSPLLGLQRYEGAPLDQIRQATRRALTNLVDLTLREKAKFLLIAGDVYDGSWRDYNTGLFFNAQMSRLRDAGVPVLLISGNHDSQSEITRSLRLPDNVRTLSTAKPETIVLEDLGVAVHGQGFATREVPQNLVLAYPDAVKGLLNIGMLHTSCTGREGHDTYAPCTMEDLARKEYGYWALGHVHCREELSREPWAVFSGNLQGRNIRETGGKGASIVTVAGTSIKSVEHRHADVFRWASCEVDAEAAIDFDDVLGRIATKVEKTCAAAEDRPLAIRIILSGSCPAHAELSADAEKMRNEARSVATTVSGGKAWVEQVKLRTTAPSAETSADNDGPEADLMAILAELEASDLALEEVAAELAELKLPEPLRVGPDALLLNDKTYLRRVLADVRQSLLPQLSSREPAGEAR